MTEPDRLAIITGTSAGIGAALADHLLEDGWQVIGISRRDAAIANPHYQHVTADLADIQQLQSIAASAVAPVLDDARWQRVGLVNNAASSGASQFLEALPPEALARAFALNTIAPIWLMGFVTNTAPLAAALRIVNVSTGAATRPLPGMGDYGASKAALRLASMTFGEELSSSMRPGGVRANASVLSYGPGVVDTEMQAHARSVDLPWNQMFKDFHAQGMLQPASAPAKEIAAYLAEDNVEPFEERHFRP